MLNSPIIRQRGWTARGRSSQTSRRIATERPRMSATVTSLLVTGGVFLAGYCALVFFPKLPTHHRTNETHDVVRLGIGIVVTWIMVIFASFGLNPPYNNTVVGAS
jgi:hypothetical protein